MARPRLELNEETIYSLANVGCTNESIAVQLGVSCNTIERRFGPVLKKAREAMKTSLRVLQLEAAKKGNVTMLIWLGKQYLGQAEKVESVSEQTVKTDIIYRTEWGGSAEENSNSDASTV